MTFIYVLVTFLSKQFQIDSFQSQLLLTRILEAAVLDTSDPSASPPPDDDLDLEPRVETEAQNKDDVSIASEGSSSTLGSTPPKVQPV